MSEVLGRTANTVGTWNIELQERSRRIIGRSAPCERAAAVVTRGWKIEQGRGNSIKILNRVLIALEKVDARLSMIEGGKQKQRDTPRSRKRWCISRKRTSGRRKRLLNNGFHPESRAGDGGAGLFQLAWKKSS